MMDFLDDFVFGPFNLLDRAIGWAQIATRRGSRKYRGRTGRFDMVRKAIPRSDKDPNIPPFKFVIQHLQKYGVDTYSYTHDSRNFYITIPKRQEKWFNRLYNNGQLWSPASSWKDKR